ncbi:hypothetical protein L0F63_006566, partial [Massospora cicadina]
LHKDAFKMLKQRKAYWHSLFECEAAQNCMWTEILQHLAAELHSMCKWVQKHWDSSCHMSRQEVALPSFEDEDNVLFNLDEKDPSDVLDVGSASHQSGPGTEATLEELVSILGEKVWRVPIHQSFVGYP